jgi:gliding motility-associated-like protein
LYYFETKYADGTCPNKDSIWVTIAELPRILSIEQETSIDKDGDTIFGKHFNFYAVCDRDNEPLEFKLDDTGYQREHLFDLTNSKRVTGTHTIYVKDNNGCQTDSTFTVEGMQLVFPKFFSPNGDDRNNVWYIKNIDYYKEIELLIYDRFGKLLDKQTNSPDWGGWSGIYLNKPLPSDDYWYVLQIKETGKKYVGHFTWLR